MINRFSKLCMALSLPAPRARLIRSMRASLRTGKRGGATTLCTVGVLKGVRSYYDHICPVESTELKKNEQVVRLSYALGITRRQVPKSERLALTKSPARSRQGRAMVSALKHLLWAWNTMD